MKFRTILSVFAIYTLCSLNTTLSLKKTEGNFSTAKDASFPHNRNLQIVARAGQRLAGAVTNYINFRIPGDPSFDYTTENNMRQYNGLYIITFSQSTGERIARYAHIQPWADLGHIQTFLDSVQPGRIILFILKNDLEYGLPKEIRDLLQSLGSMAAGDIGRGMLWGWLWVKGGRTLVETLTFPAKEKIGSPILFVSSADLSDEEGTWCPQWPDSDHWQRRREFCSKYEQYGDLCSCSNPNLLDFRNIKIENSQIEKAVTIVLAHRVPSLYKSLKSVMAARGFTRSRLEVFTPEPHKELSEFLQLLDLPLTVTHVDSEFVATYITKQFVFMIDFVLRKYEDADLLIFLEEDVSVSPDFFVYLNRTARLLKDDPSLYCVSAHNDLSYPQTSHDPRALLRTESYANYGWMVTRSFASEMSAALANKEKEFDWDVFTFFYVRGDRECVIPEVSRSHHFGQSGSHISQFSARIHFSAKNYNQDPAALVEGVEGLEKHAYEQQIASLLAQARYINVEESSPCDPDFFEKFTSRSEIVYVVFFHVEDDLRWFRFNDEWKTLAKCLGVFSIDIREGHQGLHRLRLGAAHLLLVAHPASPYSQHKPVDVPVFRATPANQAGAERALKKGLVREPFRLDPPEVTYRRLMS
ncbi:protein O-linked-mannose beta-1,2-N-acetylglucosaminyltransferase 1-like [Penaeus japonicus]|uniref:protein O-linked-mannose beta-1,2-N-acetylglucosaminyltransferase 1-like n=1 Tax=Penaeus japonicus TaxID=27405 RepID=UPI001C70DF5F|nr:protein O-linked-mannose beta-1,2-N-acetylglucosaminyltransferase 1-like [Penaeus japonicus]